MSDFLLVLGFAALPAAGNFAGGLAAEIFNIPDRVLSLALHLAAGIVLAVVGLELVPQALDGNPPWVPIAAFVAGGAVFIGLEKLIDTIKDKLATGEESTGPLAIFTGVSLDLFSDGVMIGTGSVINPALGLLLATGQVPADIPEGFAATATLKRAGFTRQTRILMAASFAIPVLLGASIGDLALRQAPEIITLSVLAATGGVLTNVVIEEMVTQAHDGPTSSLGPLLLTGGFGLFALISVYITI
ncbi:MAG: ZIP family zinc transporter [Ornithinimicrobium sp.]